MQVQIGIEKEHRDQIAAGLSALLADSYTLYVKTHNFHWNVTGPMFSTLHDLFEQQYVELAEAIDLIAERIRALGSFAPGSFAQFQELTSIDEPNVTKVPSAMEMVRQLLKDHETLVRTARQVLPVADEAGDESSVDLITERLRLHEKTAWMLRAMTET